MSPSATIRLTDVFLIAFREHEAQRHKGRPATQEIPVSGINPLLLLVFS